MPVAEPEPVFTLAIDKEWLPVFRQTGDLAGERAIPYFAATDYRCLTGIFEALAIAGLSCYLC